MTKGIIYAMTTVVPGLIKIGKTQSGQFEHRMYHLEHNGYSNVVGLKRRFAIEVEGYDDKEKLLDDIFSKSRVPNTELFALDIDLVIQLLSSFEGDQIYPKEETKAEVFEEASRERAEKRDAEAVPDGTYHMNRKLKKDGNVAWEASMDVEEGTFIIRKGQRASLVEGAGLQEGIREARLANLDEDGIVMDDVTFNSPSSAGCFITGASCNGWTTWKNKKGQLIDIYRSKED